MSTDDGTPRRKTESLEDTLRAIDTMLNGLTSSVHTRALRAKAETYRAQIAAWIARPPTEAQREALGELLDALRAKAREAAAKTG